VGAAAQDDRVHFSTTRAELTSLVLMS
jgi:hypothetical protein